MSACAVQPQVRAAHALARGRIISVEVVRLPERGVRKHREERASSAGTVRHSLAGPPRAARGGAEALPRRQGHAAAPLRVEAHRLRLQRQLGDHGAGQGQGELELGRAHRRGESRAAAPGREGAEGSRRCRGTHPGARQRQGPPAVSGHLVRLAVGTSQQRGAEATSA